MKKRFALLMAIFMVMCVATMVPVSAASATPEDESNRQIMTVDVAVPMYNSVPASAGGYISGGYGEKSCTLTRHVYDGGIEAAISPNNASGTVSCGVILPNDTYQYLGSVPASGGSTGIIPFYTLASGTYTFVFEPTTTAQLYVSGYIHD